MAQAIPEKCRRNDKKKLYYIIRNCLRHTHTHPVLSRQSEHNMCENPYELRNSLVRVCVCVCACIFRYVLAVVDIYIFVKNHCRRNLRKKIPLYSLGRLWFYCALLWMNGWMDNAEISSLTLPFSLSSSDSGLLLSYAIRLSEQACRSSQPPPYYILHKNGISRRI